MAEGETVSPSQPAPPASTPVQVEPSTKEAVVADPKPAEVAVVAEKPVEKDILTPKFAILSKREKKLQEERKQLEDYKKQLEERAKPVDEFYKDPYSFLEKNKDKVSYEEWTKRILHGQPSPESTAKEIAQQEVQKYIAQQEARRAEEMKAAANHQITYFKSSLNNLVTTNTEKYELLAHEGEDGVQTVYETILENYQQTGEMLPSDKACEMVEKFLLDKHLERNKLKKVQALLTPPVEAKASTEASKAETKSSQTQSPPKTLTNTMSSQSAIPVVKNKKLSREESIALAAEAIKKHQSMLEEAAKQSLSA
jgi:hypothetical protein